MPSSQGSGKGKNKKGIEPKEIVVWQIIGEIKGDRVVWKFVGPTDKDGLLPKIVKRMRKKGKLKIELPKGKRRKKKGGEQREIVVWQIRGKVLPEV